MEAKTTKQLARDLGLLRKRKVCISPNAKEIKKSRTDQVFSYLIVLDFESTCWENDKTVSQEIIEFPAVLLNCYSGQIESTFHHYTLPSEHPRLSEFCRNLTGISQNQVDGGIPLSFCLRKFYYWLKKLQTDKGIVCVSDKHFSAADSDWPMSKDKLAAFVTWSDWDLGVCLLNETRRKQIMKPSALDRWIDLRATYRKFYGRRPDGLNGAMKDLGLQFDGREHSGIDDATNTARLAYRMMRDGCRFQITKSLKTVGTVLNECNVKSAVSAPRHPTMQSSSTTHRARTGLPFKIMEDKGICPAEKDLEKNGSLTATGKGLSIRSANSNCKISSDPGKPYSPKQAKKGPISTNLSHDKTHSSALSLSNKKPTPLRPESFVKPNVPNSSSQFSKNSSNVYSHNIKASLPISTPFKSPLTTQSSLSSAHSLSLVSSTSPPPQPLSSSSPPPQLSSLTSSFKAPINIIKPPSFKTPITASVRLSNHTTRTMHDSHSSLSRKTTTTITRPSTNITMKASPLPNSSSSTFKTHTNNTMKASPLPISSSSTFKTHTNNTMKASPLPISSSSTFKTHTNNTMKASPLPSTSSSTFKTHTNNTMKASPRPSTSSSTFKTHTNNAMKASPPPCTSSFKTHTNNAMKAIPLPNTSSSSFKTPTTAINRRVTISAMRVTPPLCSCGRRSRRRLVQNPGPNEGRWFFSCTAGSRSIGANSLSGCGFFQWELSV